ncbi:type II toxin-antitoxin system Phd/YefM family antitoxin [Burkholderia oklahomensis]|uniref:type II toxin-antitoxin system Phd/YefM family antitoxin n=1 Tax=Burkholderia oklahomensis TaxID=342113 RepID=UPI002654C32F|nr:type II toxin-antitoxin system Phd/YefM family antitoxin [Burkholderia oklahomensis]MDN7673645.1 type II toxin-antitoxin system Phd/YefM family antitoxin [Burkholderia oklahomensis]
MTIRIGDIVPLSIARARFSELADEARDGGEKIITKNGAAYVALIDARRLDHYHRLERDRAAQADAGPMRGGTGGGENSDGDGGAGVAAEGVAPLANDSTAGDSGGDLDAPSVERRTGSAHDAADGSRRDGGTRLMRNACGSLATDDG